MNPDTDISWSTSQVGPAQRLDAWRSFLVDAFEECDMYYDAPGEFWASMECSRYGPINLGRISGSRRDAVRTSESAKTAADGVVMSIAATGRYKFAQASREQFLEPGEAYFFHNCLPGAFSADEGGEYWLISLPATAIIPGVGDTSSLIGCRISNARPEMRLLCSYVQAVFGTPGLADPQTRAMVGRQIVDLVVATVGRADAEARHNAGRGVRAARFRLLLEEVGRRLSEPMLNGERIARSLGVSERYVQQLFEENGSTISSYILDQRLNLARRLLADPAQDHRTVTDVAYACGFSDLSYFCRAFRRKFGETARSARSR